jgi:hypothetical protein
MWYNANARTNNQSSNSTDNNSTKIAIKQEHTEHNINTKSRHLDGFVGLARDEARARLVEAHRKHARLRVERARLHLLQRGGRVAREAQRHEPGTHPAQTRYSKPPLVAARCVP